jgi:hypothetical protein
MRDVARIMVEAEQKLTCIERKETRTVAVPGTNVSNLWPLSRKLTTSGGYDWDSEAQREIYK